ncbi:tyrosine-type recombinase/integrase [Microbulbifer sp. 2201CG32-9]
MMGDPVASKVTSELYTEFRRKRLAGGLETTPGGRGKKRKSLPCTENTCNHDLSYFKSMFNELIRLDNWRTENPLAKLRPLKFDQAQLTFLSLEQIQSLLSKLTESRSKYVLRVANICLATGARWGEAESLRGEQIRNNRITYAGTKSGKTRTVPISNELEAEIFADGPRTGPLFQDCYSAFVRGLEKSGIVLPRGQCTHVLRHTFASHFVMNGGNLLTLKEVLGHTDIKMTMRYAHLAPEHLEDAVTRNPLAHIQNRPRCPQSVHVEQRPKGIKELEG